MPTDTPETNRNNQSSSCCTKPVNQWLTCRQVLYMMVLLGFMFNYMLRVNLTIAIVAMVKNTNSTANATSANVTDIIDEVPQVEDDGLYDWDAYVQNLILGSFFFGYICTELPGGRLAEVVGARRVFGYSMLCASILTLITPLACNIHYIAVIVLRAVLGFMLGATWPAIPPMIAKWVPPMERSKFMANMMASSLGAAITLPICGFLIVTLGWESVFYLTGAVGVIWSVAWFALISDSPAEHPRISETERLFIEDAIGNSSSKGKAPPVPWLKLLISPPVWAIIITHACSVFGYFTVVNQLPTYSKYILHYDIKANGLLSSLPYLGKYISAIASSALADYLRQKNVMSTTVTRKVFTSIAVMGPGLLMIVQAYVGDVGAVAIPIFTLSLTLNGAVTAGYFSNGLDIAPNYSGTIFGLANTLSSFGGFLSNYIVGSLTKDKPTFEQWHIVFWMLAATYMFGGFTFLICGSGELQPWNSPDQKQQDEVMPLKKNTKVP